jgi:two-component system sensor kinase FixL
MHQFSLEITGGNDALFRALIATSADGIMVIDELGTVLVYSDACQRLFGYIPEEVLGHNIKMLMPEPYHGEHDGYLSRYRTTRERHVIGIGRDVRGRRKDGSVFPMYLSIGEGEIAGKKMFVGIVHDITSERQRDQKIHELQGELLHATRVTAMGHMSSALAHELNQPLGAILAYTGAMRRLIDEDEPPLGELREAIDLAAQDATRAGQIIRRLRAFVEKRETLRNPEDVGVLVAEAVAIGSLGLAARGIKVSVGKSVEMPKVMIDRIQIQQVLVNLIRNAVESMDETAAPQIDVTTRYEAGYVQIAVTDNGHGLAPEIADRLFEPFATTKAQGMGMGLNICRTIIESHGGRIWAEANPDGGTTFAFRLPAAEA